MPVHDFPRELGWIRAMATVLNGSAGGGGRRAWGRRLLPLVLLAALVPLSLTAGRAWSADPDGAAASTKFDPDYFSIWLKDLRKEALANGITPFTFDEATRGLRPLPEVLKRDRRQPEFTLTLDRYLSRAITDGRVQRARRLMTENADLLSEVQARYGVQARFLVSIWGLESNFGDNTGGFPVIAALVTLAYDQRRAAFFREQLLHALRIVQDGHIAMNEMTGSWAGAMGQVQFMPSTFTNYAQDGNGDGRRDIWHSLPDIFASAANYLAEVGWQGDETWGREVTLPSDFDWTMAGPKNSLPIGEWQMLGVRRANGDDLPVADIEGAIILPAGHRGPAFLVYRNYRKILIWNRSILYAIAVGHLADRIAGLGSLQTKQGYVERSLHRDDIVALQTYLAELGYAVGSADGLAGSKTRAALKAFQLDHAMPADGHPSQEAIDALAQVLSERSAASAHGGREGELDP